ncbi:MAG: hypothetical protein QOD42_1772 [Sphingomonadales bacterium]|jgi:hypothetical protein|nr:hypothetical protein [Sphingomonadales bacterium]
MRLPRRLPPAILLAALVAGCAGQVRDYVGPRSSIVRPQLIRYGFSLSEIACVGERLGETLTPRELRLFSRAAAAVQRPFHDPDRFTARDLSWVARAMPDGRVGAEFSHALEACHANIPAETAAATVPPPAAPAESAAAPAPRPPAWLNLGAAGSGQAITIDAASLEQEGSTRTAWFRMTDPPPAPPSLHSYRLRIDCARRTIQPLGHRRYDGAGAIAESRDIGPEEEAPLPIESGTVTEIAYLSLCT